MGLDTTAPFLPQFAEIVRGLLPRLVAIALGILTLGGMGLFFWARSRQKQNDDLREILSELPGVSGVDSLVEVIKKKLSERMEVVDFLRRSPDGRHLQGSICKVSLLEPSAPVNAFYNLQPCGLKRKMPADKGLANHVGWKANFVPVAMKGDTPCWKTHRCDDRSCRCHNKGYDDCWLRSANRYRGGAIPYRQKAEHCLDCPSFLPLGVFVGRGGDPHEMTEYVNTTFSSILKGAVQFDRTKQAATIDALTGLLNKATFNTSITEMVSLATRYDRPLSLMLFDIDFFKKFNDTYGHPVGDALLREMGALINNSMRDSDVSCRVGGEEFAVILPETAKEGAAQVAEKFRKAVEGHQFVADHNPPIGKVTISIGISTYPHDAESAAQLVERTDKAQYKSKRAGRNKVTTYYPALLTEKEE